MLYLWIFLTLSILCVSCYIWQVIGAAVSVSASLGIAILTALIYVFTMRLANGDRMVTGLFLSLAPARGLIIHFMVADGKQ